MRLISSSPTTHGWPPWWELLKWIQCSADLWLHVKKLLPSLSFPATPVIQPGLDAVIVLVSLKLIREAERGGEKRRRSRRRVCEWVSWVGAAPPIIKLPRCAQGPCLLGAGEGVSLHSVDSSPELSRSPSLCRSSFCNSSIGCAATGWLLVGGDLTDDCLWRGEQLLQQQQQQQQASA